MRALAGLAAAFVVSAPAFAMHLCTDGMPRGSISDSSSPDDNLRCALIGRSFCIIEEGRQADLSKEAAVNRAAKWLADLGGTGSHQKRSDKEVLKPVADFLYSHEKMAPWTAYYYSVFSCGFNMRVGPEQAKVALPKWEAAAAACMRQYPGEGDGASNDALRICLDSSMQKVIADTQGAQHSAARAHD